MISYNNISEWFSIILYIVNSVFTNSLKWAKGYNKFPILMKKKLKLKEIVLGSIIYWIFMMQNLVFVTFQFESSVWLQLCRRPEIAALPAALTITHPSDVLDMPVDPNEPTYCFCHQVSYGEMIGCDNPDVSIPPILYLHFALVCFKLINSLLWDGKSQFRWQQCLIGCGTNVLLIVVHRKFYLDV